MYIRFQTTERDCYSRVGLGVFQAALAVWYDPIYPRDDWRIRELRSELDWFNDRMDAPTRMYYRIGHRTERSGICWFRANAHEHIGHAVTMARLLNEMGVAILRLRRSDPGAILWQDTVQVVALPSLNSAGH